jgi:hypothetical protein
MRARLVPVRERVPRGPGASKSPVVCPRERVAVQPRFRPLRRRLLAGADSEERRIERPWKRLAVQPWISRSGDGCHPVQIPQNAELNALGSGWQCRRGFSRSGEGCSPVVVPQNAELNALGNGWQCKTGHTREGETCRPMTAEEFEAHRERMARLLEMARQRAARGDCETESQSGAEVCLTITNSYFDCDKSFEGTSYRGCSLSISYKVSTDYRGQSSIDVDVDCEASIDTKKRQGFSGFETAQDDESHTLYANGNDSETVRLSFDFESFEEVYGASVSTASCKIDDVSLN